MKRAIKILVVLAVLAALVGLGTVRYLKGLEVQVEVSSPVTDDLLVCVEDTGRIRLDRWQIVATPLAGVVSAVDLGPGDRVEAGQVIVRVDDAPMREGLRGARASIREIEARLEGLGLQLPREPEIKQAELAVEKSRQALEVEKRNTQTLKARSAQVARDLERLRSLSSGGVAPEADVEKLQIEKTALDDSLANQAALVRIAEFNLETARQMRKLLDDRGGDVDHLKKAMTARVDGIKSQIALLEEDQKKAEVRAPFAGVVLERYTRGNTYCMPGTPLLRIGDPASVQVEVDLLSDDLPDVGLGKKARVTGKSLGGREFEAVVHHIYPEAFTKISSLGIEQQRVKVILTFDTPGEGLVPGVSVDVKIEARRVSGALLVGENAVFTLEGKSYVWTVVGEAFVRTEVTEGESGGGRVQILSGLTPESKVVAHPDNSIDESKVAVVGKNSGKKD
jgi:HlyD family secretion protein